MSTGPTLQPEHNRFSAEPPPQAQWKAHTSGVQPAFAWAVTTIAGVAAISIFPLTNPFRWLAPVSFMLAYAWVTYPRTLPVGLRSARIAQLADSAYFLGFLWTLWALIDSFALKKRVPSEAAFEAFAYALFTTATGMAIRLYLLNFKYGAEEQAGEAEVLIEERLQALGDAMSSAQASVQDFSRKTEVLNSRVASLTESLSTVDADFADTHKRTTDSIKKNIDETVHEISTLLKTPAQEYGRAIRDGAKLLAETAENSSKIIRDGAQTVVEDVQAHIRSGGERVAADYDTMMREVSKNIGDFLSGARRLAEELGRIDIPTAHLSQLGERLVALNNSVLVIADAIGPAGALSVNIGHAAEEIERQSDAVRGALSEVARRISAVEVPASVTFGFSTLVEAIKALEASVSRLTATATDPRLEKAPQTAADAILRLTSSVNNFRQSVEKAGAAIGVSGQIDKGTGRGRRGLFGSLFGR